MSAYGWAWLVIAAALPAGLFCLHRVTRGIHFPRTKLVLALLLAAWALAPAPVPGFPDDYAPAFLVFGFEALFQRPGDPRTAGLILAAATALALALALGLVLALRRRAPGESGDSA